MKMEIDSISEGVCWNDREQRKGGEYTPYVDLKGFQGLSLSATERKMKSTGSMIIGCRHIFITTVTRI